MWLSWLYAVFMVQLVLAAPMKPNMIRRTSDDITGGIATLTNDINALQNTLGTFKANDLLSTFTALKIQQQTSTVESDLRDLIAYTKNTPSLSGSDSGTVATAVVNLATPIRDLLNAIVAAKPAFSSAVLFFGDLSRTVEASLLEQKQLSGEFGDALVPILAEPYRDYAPLLTGQISQYFDTAIAAYQGCDGLICLPPLPTLRKKMEMMLERVKA